MFICRHVYVVLLSCLIEMSETNFTKGLQYFNKHSYNYRNTK